MSPIDDWHEDDPLAPARGIFNSLLLSLALWALLLFVLAVLAALTDSARAEQCPNPGEIMLAGKCAQVMMTTTNFPTWTDVRRGITVSCPAGYEMVWRFTGWQGCAKDVFDAR